MYTINVRALTWQFLQIVPYRSHNCVWFYETRSVRTTFQRKSLNPMNFISKAIFFHCVLHIFASNKFVCPFLSSKHPIMRRKNEMVRSISLYYYHRWCIQKSRPKLTLIINRFFVKYWDVIFKVISNLSYRQSYLVDGFEKYGSATAPKSFNKTFRPWADGNSKCKRLTMQWGIQLIDTDLVCDGLWRYWFLFCQKDPPAAKCQVPSCRRNTDALCTSLEIHHIAAAAAKCRDSACLENSLITSATLGVLLSVT